MNTIHRESLGDNFEFFQKSSVTFNRTESWHSVNIVNGYGKNFVYYMYSDADKKLIYCVIYLLGTKEDARNYLIDFEIISKSSAFQKVRGLKIEKLSKILLPLVSNLSMCFR